MEGRIAVQDRLHVILARRELAEALHRIAKRFVVDDRGSSRWEPVDVDAEERLRLAPAHDVKAWLFVVAIRQQQQDAAIDRRVGERRGHGDLETDSVRPCETDRDRAK
jgi:hypothetical protein